jgi:hypothetical protein
MKLKLKQIADAALGINNVETKEGSGCWMYAIPKNKGKMKDDMQGIANAQKPFEEEDRKRIKYCMDHCVKDAEGKPVIVQDASGMKVYKGIKNDDPKIKGFLAKMRGLDARFMQFLETEVEVDIHMIPFEDVPKTVSPLDFERIAFMVEEPRKR